jgi:hypothetical protein
LRRSTTPVPQAHNLLLLLRRLPLLSHTLLAHSSHLRLLPRQQADSHILHADSNSQLAGCRCSQQCWGHARQA